MAIIEFLCPNGHKIRCNADQAGRPAKCTRCGVRFRVPDPAELEGGQSDVLSRPGVTDFDFLDDKPAPPKPAAPPQKDTQMEFLCPNGHRLFGSVSLAGKPGECPDCGARFRIPSYEEISLDEKPPVRQPAPPQPSLPAELELGDNDDDYGLAMPSSALASAPAPAPAPASSLASSPSSALLHNPRPPARQGDAEQAWEEEVMPATVWSVAAGTALTDQPIAQLFARLWTTRPKGARVELQMRDGEDIVVEQFVATLSQQSHGVFAVRTPDNTFTLMAIAWDTIARIMVRGLTELPK